MPKLKSKYYIEDDSMNEDNSSGSDQADGDVIRCICDDTSDDGFTIQCEKCEDWQHASCVNIKKNKIPDHYICERCSKKQKRLPFDIRRSLTSDNDLNDKRKKKLLKRNRKRVYMEDSDENEEQYMPPKISRKKFTPLSKSVFKEKLVEDLLIEVHRQWIELNRPSSTSGKTESKVTLNKGLESIVVMESNLLLPAIPKASVKPLKKSLRGSYFQNQKDPSVEKGVFADIHIPEHRYLMEVTGELLRKSEYKNNPENNFSLLGTPLAHVFFYRSIDICIDARFAGNDTRYIRRSCCPNSEIKSIILPNDNEDQTIHMGIYTSEEVDRGEEITIGWNWHRGLLMWHKNKDFLRKNYTVDINASERKTLKKTLKLLTDEFGDCACEDKDECLIECLKDELNNDNDEEPSTSNTKKKRLTKPRTLEKKAEPKKPRPSDIFSSDEEEKSRHNSIKEEKSIQYINKNTNNKKKSTPIPSSPAVSVTESVDIDIMSMSPAQSEGESDTHTVKRAKLTDVQLPVKKRWLRLYLSQQQELKVKLSVFETPQPSVDRTHIPTENEEEDESIDVDGELSDVASSESTLPLEDTPTNNEPPKDNTKQDSDKVDTASIDVEMEDVQPESSVTVMDHTPSTLAENVQQPNIHQATVTENVQQPTITETVQQPTVTENIQQPTVTENIQQAIVTETAHQAIVTETTQQSNGTENVQQAIVTENVRSTELEDGAKSEDSKQDEPPSSPAKPARRKLTLQEYLSMRRGNLPTPDEKPPAE